MTDGDGEASLPARPPRPLVVHWLVDAAVVFLVTVIVGLIFGVSLLWVAGIALAVGLALAPLTRNIEERGLASRHARDL